MLSTCSFTSGLVSKALTIAPILLAAPIAASPATPAPITSTFAGGIFPAAVICPVKNLPKYCDASTIARYPAIFAIELSASIFCALDILGILSTANAFTFLSANSLSSSGFCAGARNEMNICPSLRSLDSSSLGSLTLRIISAVSKISFLESEIFTPTDS